jgi:fumarate reductase flavoprotein subunit
MPNVTFTANAIAQQKDKTALLLFDTAILDDMQRDFDTRNRVFQQPASKISAIRPVPISTD